MDRREFVKRMTEALLALPVFAQFGACADDGDYNYGNGGNGARDAATDAGDDEDAGAGAVCPDGARATSISGNHGHSLSVSRADVLAGVDKTYSIEGTATHDHEVTLTAADFASLAAGNSEMVMSMNGPDHEHTVTVRCA